jgi:glycosyltransferase involved in cell wall biosynthesis
MRIGNNPNRNNGANSYTPIILTCVTHLPNLTGYHERRLKVVQTCLETMRDNAQMETTVIVWDNGSCREFRDWLQFEYKPDMVMLSENIGKTAARASLFRMLPPKSTVAYCDDDIYHYSNWLRPQIELLKHFPKVAAVTGYPVRTQFRWGVAHTHEWARQNGIMETGRFIPREWEDDFAVSIGRDPAWHNDYTKNDLDYRATYKGVTAYLTSHHCQLIGRQEILSKSVHYDGMAMGDEKPFDAKLDELGLRLATTERLTRHIGNVMDGFLA